MPFLGSVLEQPYALLVLGTTLRRYAQAYAMYTADRKNCPAAVKRWVMQISAADFVERRRDIV